MSIKKSLPRPGKSAVLLVGAVLFGLFAVYAAKSYIHLSIDKEASKYRSKAETVGIVVAKQNLPEGTIVSEDNMAIRQVPKEMVASSMIRPEEFAKASGSRLQVGMRSGDPLVWPVLERWDATTFSGRLVAGVRAITIPVDDVNSISGMIHPGDLIDLYLTAKPPELPGGAKIASGEQTFMLFQAMHVLATGQTVRTDKAVAAERNTAGSSYTSLTLGATPDQAQKIMVAQKAGNFRIALRNPSDEAAVKSQAMDTGTLFGSNPTIEHTGALAEVLVGGHGISRQWQAVGTSAPGGAASVSQSAGAPVEGMVLGGTKAVGQ